jgi:hypothetical protein
MFLISIRSQLSQTALKIFLLGNTEGLSYEKGRAMKGFEKQKWLILLQYEKQTQEAQYPC